MAVYNSGYQCKSLGFNALGPQIRDVPSERKIDFDEKSPTWDILRNAANLMISRTEEDRRRIEALSEPKRLNLIRFNRSGRHSIFDVVGQMLGYSPTDNSITWAINKLLPAGINIRKHETGSNVITNSVFKTEVFRYTREDLQTFPYTTKELCRFAQEGDFEAILLNFSPGVNVDEPLQNACIGPMESFLGPCNALSIAAFHGHYDVVRILVDTYNANPNVRVGRWKDFTALGAAKLRFFYSGVDPRIQQKLAAPRAVDNDHIELRNI